MLAANAHPALVLNADFQPVSYFPLSTMPWQDAIRAVHNKTVAVVSEYDIVARSPTIEMKLPSVIALRSYVKPPARVAFTRFNVFLRDHFHCQYCGEKHKPGDLTFDHVVPRAKGGVTSWTNIVAACSPCNTKKDRHIVRPIRMPKQPTVYELLNAQKKFPPGYLHESWRDYLYWDSELEA